MRLLVLLTLCLFGCSKSYTTPSEIYGHAATATVLVTFPNDSQSGGSGFYIKALSGAKVVITNAHICGKPRTPLKVVSDKDGTFFYAIPKYISYNNDLCVISTRAKDSHTPFRLSRIDASPGEVVYSSGHPMLAPLTINTQLVIGKRKEGVVYGVEFCNGGRGNLIHDFIGRAGCFREQEATLIDGMVRPGNSGGPILNKWGEVTGVVYAGSTTQGSAITLKTLRALLNKF